MTGIGPVAELCVDHLAVAAPTLETGVEHVRHHVGVDVPAGGRHPLMATHNHLARLGDDEFLEVIAVDPQAEPQRPRWFGLDRQAGATPCLSTWVVRTDDLDTTLAGLPPECGRPVALTRGELHWRLSVPDDGSMPFDGMFPTLIEWPQRPLPATRMADVGCALERLTVCHPQAVRIESLIGHLLDDPRVVFVAGETTGLSAAIMTPSGRRLLT